MKKVFTISIFFLLILRIGFGQVYTLGTTETTIGQDNANNYSDNWVVDNQGDGFSNWSFDNSTPNGGFSGRFIGSFSADLDVNSDSFVLFANSGNDATAGASVNFPKSMQIGDSFTVKVGVNFRDGAKGFDLRDNSNASIVNFNVGSDRYNLAGTDLFTNTYDANTVITFTFIQNENSISWTADRSGGLTASQNGTISDIASGVITNIRFYNVSAGTNNDGGSGERNLFLNSLDFNSKHTIPNTYTATLSDNYSAPYVTILLGGTLILNNYTLSIASEGTLTNNGTFTAGNGKVSFDGAGTVSGTVAFNDVDISGGVNFGDNSTVAGVLQINASGYVNTKAPTYETGSILRYNTGTDYGISSEWYADQTSGAGVPYNVDISSSTQVHFSGNQDHTMNGTLTIASGKIFSLSETIGADLFIKGDFINNGGTFNSNSRLVTFNGTTSQEIKGTGPTSFGYVTIANSAGVSINGAELITVANDLTVNASTSLSIEPGKSLTVTGNLTNNAGATGLVIKSDVNGTGSLKHNSDNVVATVQRYMSESETWRLVSSPVDNQVIIDVDNWTPTGSYEGGHGYDFYAYQESSATWLNQKVGANNITNFTPGQGYLVSFEAANQTKTFGDGEANYLNNGNVVIAVTKNGSGDYAGANLIGNPYPSGIDWNDADRSLFSDNYAYVYDRVSNVGETYEGYALVDGSVADAFIAPHQGFFVIKDVAGSSDFTFTNAMRAHGGTFTKAPTNFSGLKLKVSNGSYYDLATININETASFDRDRMDAIKFYSNNANMPNFYTISKDGRQLAINTIPSIQIEEPIVMGITVPANGNYEISLNEQGADFADKVIYLEDLLTGIRHSLTNDGSYSYSASTSDNPNRFLLHFGVVGIGEQEQAPTLQAYMVDNRLYVNNSLEQAQLAIYDLQGRLVAEQSLNSGGLQSLPLDLPAGVYIVRLNNASESRAAKINVQ
ncbi:MAG: T9SS type A sorting domain-containing protein [Bacteroidales bacterium]|nr:T9SS type A sorting domain-containing protein [Bacteroidales bacterium]